METFFKKLEYHFLIESFEIENASVLSITAISEASFNPIQDGFFQGCSRMGEGGGGGLKSITQILQWWNLAQLHLT